MDLDDIEAAGSLRPPAPGQERRGHACDPSALPCRDGFGRTSEDVARPGLHLDEDDEGAVPRDEVDLAVPRPKSARDDRETRAAKPALRGPLPGAPEEPSRIATNRS